MIPFSFEVNHGTFKRVGLWLDECKAIIEMTMPSSDKRDWRLIYMWGP